MNPPEPKQRFEEIYMANYAAVMSYVRRRTDSPDDAADALSETFATAWRKLDEVPRGDEARLWLYGVARRVLANQRRGDLRRTALAVRLRTELTAWAESVAGEDDPDAVRDAFKRLSHEDREVLALVGWEGLSPAEIAVVLGCSRPAVRVRLHRARKRLAKELASAGLDVSRYGARAVDLVEAK
ncbi:RNA polymerase sigma factor [Bailinhaonella thermotolerans]|uniref:RNA polymerase sigma factor n=1 Tax=Bailinhaonella thermotolerans TaxID=1070861 RepID=A0A3A4AV56_9ACTN|nr:RNA polymerase sigma factor [Bailinhaonella thermotolerans]RJL29967.1 RNA polymerase sigma factor [Bailinhaonella thermotolerans]